MTLSSTLSLTCGGVALLKALRATTINTLRNQVVHKRAYRPTREEAESALEETRSIIFPLTQRLGLYELHRLRR